MYNCMVISRYVYKIVLHIMYTLSYMYVDAVNTYDFIVYLLYYCRTEFSVGQRHDNIVLFRGIDYLKWSIPSNSAVTKLSCNTTNYNELILKVNLFAVTYIHILHPVAYVCLL